jgi:hypothetical protein
MTTTYPTVTTAAQLSDEIREVDLASQGSGGGTGTQYLITIAAGATLTESAEISAINLKGSDTLTIAGQGQGASLDGASLYRGLFAYSGNLTVENLTIENAVANGGAGAGGGGGGAGLGGGLFVANDSAHGATPANVRLINVSFTNDSAAGGAGGSGNGGGGGGMGGSGGSGGGGVGSTAHGGGAGLIPGAAGGGAGGNAGSPPLGAGGPGGASGGGGGTGGHYFIFKETFSFGAAAAAAASVAGPAAWA